MTTTEEHLGRFYIELQAWIDGGCKEHECFHHWRGLCGNVAEWQRINAPEYTGYFRLWDALGRQFKSAGLDQDHPFPSLGSKTKYYTNPARLAWIKEHAEAAKAAGLAVAS